MKICVEESNLICRYALCAAAGVLLGISLIVFWVTEDCEEGYLHLGKGYYCSERFGGTLQDMEE